MDTKNEELKNCYFVKTVLMLAVILYHSLIFWSGQGWGYQEPVHEVKILGMISKWLGSFHVYGFTLVSGYIFYALKYEQGKYTDYFMFIKNKLKRLLLPYGFAVIVWVVPITAFWSRGGIIRKYVLMESPSQLWFLIMLLDVFILYYPISDFINRHVIFGFMIMIGIYGLGRICGHFMPDYFQLWTAFQYMIFFFYGCIIRKFGIERMKKIPCVIYILCDILVFAGYIFASEKKEYLWISKGLLFCVQSIGAVGIFIIIQKFARKFILPDGIRKLGGQYSMTIYLFHQQLIYVSLMLGNGYINDYCLAVINFLFALFGAGGIAILLHNFSITRYLVTGKP